MRTRIVVAVIFLLALILTVIGVVFVLSPRHHEQKEAEAREKLAFVSLTDRLPQGKPIPPAKQLSPEAKERWESLDKELATYQER